MNVRPKGTARPQAMVLVGSAIAFAVAEASVASPASSSVTSGAPHRPLHLPHLSPPESLPDQPEPNCSLGNRRSADADRSRPRLPHRWRDDQHRPLGPRQPGVVWPEDALGDPQVLRWADSCPWRPHRSARPSAVCIRVWGPSEEASVGWGRRSGIAARSPLPIPRFGNARSSGRLLRVPDRRHLLQRNRRRPRHALNLRTIPL